jgi:hypothetical protein
MSAMLISRGFIGSSILAVTVTSHALVALPDEALADVTGRDGVSLVIDGAGWSTSGLNYTQDGETLSLKGLKTLPVKGASSLSTLKIDALNDRVALTLSVPQTEYRVDDIVIGSPTRTLGSARTFIQTDASLVVKPSIQPAGDGLSLDGSVQLKNGTTYLRYDGFDLIAKGVRLGANFTNTLLKLPVTNDGNDIRIEFSNAGLSAGITGLSLDLANGDAVTDVLATPLSPDTRDPNASLSFGGLAFAADLNGSVTLAAGGASSQGIRVRPDMSWSRGTLEYKGTGVIRSTDFNGSLSSKSGLTIDLEKDPVGSYIQFAASDFSVTAQMGKLVVGSPDRSKLGSVGLGLLFEDTVNQKNSFKLRPGGDVNAGTQGITTEMRWNLVGGSATITDNSNSLWLSGLKSYGNGTMALDITRSCSSTLTVTGCYAGTLTDQTKGNYNGHFDGLRFGFSNVTGAYSFDGIRVGTSSSPLQGGTELLLLAGVYPAYDFTLNGHVTLSPGGKVGDGFRFNADVILSKVNAAVSTDELGKGIWLTDAAQEMHYRNGFVDVSNDGLEINKGEFWSLLEANDLRLGSKNSGTSVGRLLLKTYEMGSTLSLATGGSGALCVGAVAVSATNCATAGGRWEDRGNEGLSIKLNSLYVRDDQENNAVNGIVTDEKRNQIALEARRTVDANGKPVNGTGVQVVLDNFWSSDAKVGDANSNLYGFKADLGIDVAPTVVISKIPPFTQTSPLGFAVNGRVSFKEIGSQRLQMVHPTGGGQTVLHGMRLQNADVRFNLTATPIN